MQIGKRIRRLERAQLSAERQRKKRRPGPDIDIQEGMRMNLDARYEVPLYRNDPVNIYNFVRTHQGDPAIKVSFPLIL